MTVQDNFLKADFDIVLSCIITRHGEKWRKSAAPFKEAFDTMRLIEVEPEDDDEPVEVYIHWHQWEGEDAPKPEVNAGAFHASPWAVIAGREVTVEDGLDIGVDEAAALMLWELTFWGFTPEQVGLKGVLDDEEESLNKYDMMRKTFKVRLYRHHVKRKYRAFDRNGWPIWRLEDCRGFRRRRKMNRPKRKREYRQDMREDWLESMSGRENVLLLLTRNDGARLDVKDLLLNPTARSSSFRREDIEFAMQAESFVFEQFTSHTETKDERVGYIEELLTNYYQWPTEKEYTDVIVFVRTAAMHVPTDDEAKRIDKVLERAQNMNVLIGIGTDNSLGDNLQVCFLWLKR